jgi:hypothetical protein
MRLDMHDPAWWAQYAGREAKEPANPGRTAFDRGVKSKLIMDLVENLEHSFRLILNQLDPANKASVFANICQSLFRARNPHLSNVPPGSELMVQMLTRLLAGRMVPPNGPIGAFIDRAQPKEGWHPCPRGFPSSAMVAPT